MPETTPFSPVQLGLDIGTSRIKAAAFDRSGNRTAGCSRAAPPLSSWHGLAVQDPLAMEAEALAVLSELLERLGEAGEGGGPESATVRDLPGALPLALTGQRDTLLLAERLPPGRGGGSGTCRPMTPLLSWRERRHLEDPILRSRLLAHVGEGGDADGAVPMSLEAWLLARWGEGVPVAGLRTTRPRFAGGDKNCEYLAMGARPDVPELGVISLGSAISLGVAVGGATWPEGLPPGSLPPGVVVTPMAGAQGAGWNVETGVLSGMPGLRAASALAGVAPWTGPLPTEPEEDLVCVPHFGGAMDDPEARGLLSGGCEEDRTSQRVARAWAQGVAAELARLRPRIEVVSGVPLARIRMAGGAARDPAWGPLLGEALGLPWERCPDPWAGCRGAVMAVAEPEAPSPAPAD